jgi:hypothetical protein
VRAIVQPLTAVICRKASSLHLRCFATGRSGVPALVEAVAEQHVPPLCFAFCRLAVAQPRVGCRLLHAVGVALLLGAVLVLNGLVVQMRKLQGRRSPQ